MHAATTLEDYIEARTREASEIEPARRAELDQLAQLIRARMETESSVPMTFICTHNSRRSHLGQIWAQVAADRFGLAKVTTFSGGTEATAFNPRAVAALERAGFDIESNGDAENPRYGVPRPGTGASMECFSKVYGDAANPSEGYIAIMTCDSADDACPVVAGAAERFALKYVDPKAHDGTDREAAAYDERCAQIARELLYAFRAVSALRSTAR